MIQKKNLVMLRILIVDDEPSSGNILKILIEKHIPLEKEIRCCTDPAEALELIKSNPPNLIMLDIEMPGMNGFDFLNRACCSDFDVIFTTAYDRYAIKAIRFSALDYLLKPVDIVELQNAINRHIIKKQYHNHLHQQQLVDNLVQNLQKNDHPFKLAVSVKEGVFLFELKNIIFLEGQNNYTRIFFDHQKPLLVSRTIGDYEDMLGEYQFYRVHKSYLVNQEHVVKVDNEGMLGLSNGMSVPLSRRKKAEVMEKIVGSRK